MILYSAFASTDDITKLTQPGVIQLLKNQLDAARTAVGYQDTPKRTRQCDNCAQWQPPSSGQVVAGNIKTDRLV